MIFSNDGVRTKKIKKMDAYDEKRLESRCVFRDILHTCSRRSHSEFREINVESLKKASRKRKENFYNRLSKDTGTLTAHEKCNLEYKSLDHIRRYLKRSSASANEGQWSGGAIKCTRRSHSAMPFDFKSDCISVV